jgi:hypothetical protein
MTVHNLNEHRKAAQQRKADALRLAVKDEMVDEASTPQGLRLLAKAVWLGRDRTEMWARYALLAGVNPPGSSSGDPTDVIRLVADGLDADADALDAELEDPVLIAQLQASLDALRAG